jgi:hypothetical protein
MALDPRNRSVRTTKGGHVTCLDPAGARLGRKEPARVAGATIEATVVATPGG